MRPALAVLVVALVPNSAGAEEHPLSGTLDSADASVPPVGYHHLVGPRPTICSFGGYSTALGTYVIIGMPSQPNALQAPMPGPFSGFAVGPDQTDLGAVLLSAGCATLVPSNRPGGPTTFQVDFYVPGNNAWSTNCPASAPCTPPVEARLFARHGSLRGRVTNSAGEPVGAGEVVAVYKVDQATVHRTVTTDAQGSYDFTTTDAAILLNLDPDVCPSCKPFVAGRVPLAPDNHWGLTLDPAFTHAPATRYYIAVAGSDAGLPRPPGARNARLAFLRSSHLTNLDLSNSPCKLPPLTPITDPDAQNFEAHNGNIYDFDHLTPPMQAAVVCFGEAVTAANGTFVPLSGWRPAAYQAHLREVWRHWRNLETFTAEERAECTDLVAALTAEWNAHGLAYQPAATSWHTQGRAIDAQVNVSTAPDPLASGCGLRRSLPATDPNHYVLN